MSVLDRLKHLFLSKSEPCPPEDPWCVDPAPAPTAKAVDPWRASTQPPRVSRTIHPTWEAGKQAQAVVGDIWRPPQSPFKVRVLRNLAKVMIIVNIVLGVFFYSTNWVLNASLWGYLGVATILLGHYLSVSR